MLVDLPDEELMLRYQEGSSEAFYELYRRHSAKVYGYLLKRTKSVETAQELMQEVFVKIHHSKTLYRSEHPLLPWFFSVTQSVFLDWARKQKRSVEVQYVAELSALENSAPIVSPELDLSSQLQQLPESQRGALQLRYVEEKTFEEIAALLATTPSNARQLVSRGVNQLRRLLGKKGDV